MREKKNRKQKRIQITAALKRELKWFIEVRKDNEYLLQSRQGRNRPIGRVVCIYKILARKAEFGLDEQENTYVEKTSTGIAMYMQTKNIALLMEI